MQYNICILCIKIYLIKGIMFVNMVFVYDKLDKAANGINMNGLEFPCSEPRLLIGRQCHISSSNHQVK